MLARAGRKFLGRTAAARTVVRAVAGSRVAAISSLRAGTTDESLLAANIGNGRDAEDYALLAASNPKDVRRIVVVKVGGEVITKEPETLARSLKFLQSQGLQPVVVHGGGPQLNDELKKAGVEPNYIGGHRVTDAPTMAVARRVFEAANDQLAAEVVKGGLTAAAIKGGVFMAEVHDPALGLVGQIKSVQLAAVEEALAAGRVPVLTSLGLSAAGETLNINADVAARELAIALRPMRVVFISAGGGWKEDGKVVPSVNMAVDYPVWVRRDYTGRQGTLLKLNEMKAIVDHLPPSSAVTITSAAALAAQVLPHRGPGSQIRRGTKLVRFDSAGAVDGGRLRALLLAAGDTATAALFDSGSSTSGSSTAATGVRREHIIRVITTDDYSAAAVVAALPSAAPASGADAGAAGAAQAVPVVLSMALSTDAYWEGSEQALWTELSAQFPGGVAWLAGPAPSVAAAAEAVAKGGRDAVPKSFPLLTARRSIAFASAGLSVSGAAPADADVGTLAAGPSVFFRGPLPAGRSVADVAAAVAAYAGAKPVSGSAAAVPAAGATVSAGSSTAAAAAATAAPAKSANPLRVGLLGARGYVGRELVRLLHGHPSLQVTAASSRAYKGQDVLAALGVPEATGAVAPGLIMSDFGPAALREGAAPEVDVWVLALPNGLAAEHVAAIEAGAGRSVTSAGGASAAKAGRAPLIIDLSADYRFDDSGSWVYGLPERPGARDRLRTARKIANPGCYATGAQVALMPLMPSHAQAGIAGLPASVTWDLSIPPHVFGVSGYSGAGTNPSDKNNADRLRDNLLPYSLTRHIHEREIGRHCGDGARVAFMPHVAPFFQGISLTVTGHLRKDGASGKFPALSADDFAAAYGRFYGGEKLISVRGAAPNGANKEDGTPDVARHGTGKHGVTVGGFSYDASCGRLALVSCIDNLLKGAATQAVQNMNIALSLPEYDGIPA